MNRHLKSLGIALVLALFGGIGGALAANDVDYPDEPAMASHMAHEALLLDIAEVGDRLVAVGEYGHVVISDDGGETWTQAEYVPTRKTLTGVSFADELNGWAVGHDAIIIHTADGGTTWTRQYIDVVGEDDIDPMTGDAPPDNTLLTVHFFDADHGLAMGAFSLVLETYDGGENWDERDLNVPVDDSDPYYFPEEYHLNAMFLGPDDTIFVAAEFGTVYRSMDGGENFEEIVTPYEGSFWGGLNTGNAVLVFGMRGNLWRTEDLGDNWDQVDSDTVQSLGGGTILDDGSIVIAGLGGAVIYSTDGGQSFESVIRPQRRGHSTVADGGNGHVVVVGEAGAELMPARAADYSPDLY